MIHTLIKFCSTGTQLDTLGTARTCVHCPANSVNPGQGISCTNCSLQHYTRASISTTTLEPTQQECLACPRGKIRQQLSNFTTCEFCPRLYALSENTQQCELCVQPIDPSCIGREFGTAFIDDCSSLTQSPHGCVCGCRVCELYEYRGIIANFVVLPGCQPSCDDGYKLQHITDGIPPLVCTKNSQLLLQTEFAMHNNGHMKFRTRNSLDFTIAPCVEFFSLTQLQLASSLHIVPSLPPLSAQPPDMIRVNNSILASYITHSFELLDIDESCFFRCSNGYTTRVSLSTNISECVLLPATTACSHKVAAFEKISSCLIGP